MTENITINEGGKVQTEQNVIDYVQPILDKIEVEKTAIEQETASHNAFVASHLQKIEELKEKLSILIENN